MDLGAIYKLDSKGNIRVSELFVEGSTLTQKSGIFGGSLVTHPSEFTGKNIGKSNETTPHQQAISVGKAKIEKKLREGYFLTIEEARDSHVVKPMLAKVYEKESHKINWDRVFIQHKSDGMRCTIRGSKLYSRINREITTLPHLTALAQSNKNLEGLDGELYAEGLSFQENMKLIKKHSEDSVKICFHVFDVISSDCFRDRQAYVHNTVHNEIGSPYLIEVPSTRVISEEEIKGYHEKFLEQGYEGSIIRWGDAGYEVNKRSQHLLKVKDSEDVALEIIDVVPSDKIPEQGKFICRLSSTKVIDCGMKFSHAERAEFLINKENYIGLTAEVRYFGLTDAGKLRHPRCVGFRLDK